MNKTFKIGDRIRWQYANWKPSSGTIVGFESDGWMVKVDGRGFLNWLDGNDVDLVFYPEMFPLPMQVYQD